LGIAAIRFPGPSWQCFFGNARIFDMIPAVDLYSDTVTRPTKGMRRFIADAEVGNEQAGEDPTVNRLCAMVAEILGKEAAVYLPSGTMCNQIAYRVVCRPGDEIIMDKTAHPLHSETGGVAALSGAMTRQVNGVRGIFTGDQVREAVRNPKRNRPISRALSVENTSNQGGGSVWPLEKVKEVTKVAHDHGLVTHLDGARLFNAVVASGVSASDYAACFDSLWIDFSKGLGAPVGAALAGTADFIEEAWRIKHQFGGAMRQAGIIAAGCIYALEHNIDRLAEDHENAQILARGLNQIPGIAIEPDSIETNLVYFDVSGTGMDGAAFAERLLEHGVRIGPTEHSGMRAVTHLDVDRPGVEIALTAVRSVAAAA
jgi:threonine aldolase